MKCDYCGNEISRKDYDLNKKNKHYFCDRYCYSMFKRQYNEIIIKETYAEIIMDSKKYGRNIALIDIEDIEKVKQYKWYVDYNKNFKHFYVKAHSKEKVLKLHRFITNCPNDKVIDHINHNTLDNRKTNLKVCTQFENAKNKLSNTSGHVGVVWWERDKKWKAQITVNNKNKHLGYFEDINDAINARLQAEKKYYNV